MNHKNFNTIDPSQSHVPDSAVIQKVLSDNDRLPAEQHDKAVKAFFVSDGIASGIGKDLAFVDQIPNLIKEIIDNRLWECLYIAKSVVTPYYCRYTKGTDAENFRAFITAKRPNGLETSIDTIDRVLQADLEVQRKFRAIFIESEQGQRTDLIDGTSGSDCPKLDLSERQQKNLRAANRAAQAIPVIGELLDRGLIAIDVAALLGRDIKDPESLTAEEREYIDKRDLVGLRISQYIYTNPILEDEDKEPAYSRELNSHVKDLLGIKDRSKSVRMDNPKKAAEKLLQFYQGDKLQDLIAHLRQGVGTNAVHSEPTSEQSNHRNSQHSSPDTALSSISPLSTDIGNAAAAEAQKNQPASDEAKSTIKLAPIDTLFESEKIPATRVEQLPLVPETEKNASVPLLKFATIDNRILEFAGSYKVTESEVTQPQNPNINMELTADQLAERLKRKRRSVIDISCQKPAEFPQWSQKRDPDGIAWQRSDKKKDAMGYLFQFKNHYRNNVSVRRYSMLSKTEFDAWCCSLSLSQHTQNLIEKIRSSEPSRCVGGGRKNVSGRYPSRSLKETLYT